jgi:hypothetical protein
VRTSPFCSTAYSLRCKIEKFEAILFPRRSCRRCLRTADRRAPVPEAAVVHPKCAKSRSGSQARPYRTKADTPRCSSISTSYCHHPRPASCTPSQCHRRRHRHCLCRARWHIDRPPHHPTLGGVPEIIVSHVFDEDGFDPCEEASLRIPETGQHSKECFVSSGVPHPRNLISYPLYRQTPSDVVVAAHTAHGRASTA